MLCTKEFVIMGEYTVSQRKEQQPSLPLHRQIAQAIRQDIAQRELGPHSKLPSELELTRRYGVSHNTMNKSIGLLVHQGVLYRRRPQGTFVAAADSDELPLSGDNREQLSRLHRAGGGNRGPNGWCSSEFCLF